MNKETKIALLKGRIIKAESKEGGAGSGVVRKLNRQIRNLSK